MVSYGRFNRSNTSIKSSGRRTNYRRRRFGYTTKKRGYRLSTYALRKLGVERKYLDKALTSNATLQNTGANGSTPVEGNAGLHTKVVIGMSIILLQILIRLFKNLRLVI